MSFSPDCSSPRCYTPPNPFAARVQLPTEAQWEYACRAGTETAYYSGDTEADMDRAGWYDANSGKTTHPVGQKGTQLKASS